MSAQPDWEDDEEIRERAIKELELEVLVEEAIKQENEESMKKQIGPSNGLHIVLDSSQIVPHDPGYGTPAMVYKGDSCATFHCAIGEGELDDEELLDSEVLWLQQQEDIVDEFISRGPNQ